MRFGHPPLNRYLTDTVALGHGQWVPREHQRRLNAYRILAAAASNNLREVAETNDAGQMPEMAEWGEAALILKRTVAGLLSDEVHFTIGTANTPPPAAPPTPDDIPQPDEGDTNAQAAYDAAVAQRDIRYQQQLEEWTAAHDRTEVDTGLDFIPIVHIPNDPEPSTTSANHNSR